MKHPILIVPLLALAPVAALVALVSCGDTGSSSPPSVTESAPRFGLIANPNAIKLPIHAEVSSVNIQQESVSGECRSSVVRATAYDANHRQIADALIVWSTTDSTVVAIDSLGYAHAVSCPHDVDGHAIMDTVSVGIIATLRGVR